jgi:hypothetical protein
MQQSAGFLILLKGILTWAARDQDCRMGPPKDIWRIVRLGMWTD